MKNIESKDRHHVKWLKSMVPETLGNQSALETLGRQLVLVPWFCSVSPSWFNAGAWRLQMPRLTKICFSLMPATLFNTVIVI